jgi:hypothetical protein
MRLGGGRAAAEVRVAGVAKPPSGFIFYLLAVFLLRVEVVCAQDELNKILRARKAPWMRG